VIDPPAYSILEVHYRHFPSCVAYRVIWANRNDWSGSAPDLMTARRNVQRLLSEHAPQHIARLHEDDDHG